MTDGGARVDEPDEAPPRRSTARWTRYGAWIAVGAAVGVWFGMTAKSALTGGQAGQWVLAGLWGLGMIVGGFGLAALLVVLLTRGRHGWGAVLAFLTATTVGSLVITVAPGRAEPAALPGWIDVRSSAGVVRVHAICNTWYDEPGIQTVHGSTGTADRPIRLELVTIAGDQGFVRLVVDGGWMDYDDVDMQPADELRRTGTARLVMLPVVEGSGAARGVSVGDAAEAVELRWTCHDASGASRSEHVSAYATSPSRRATPRDASLSQVVE